MPSQSTFAPPPGDPAPDEDTIIPPSAADPTPTPLATLPTRRVRVAAPAARQNGASHAAAGTLEDGTTHRPGPAALNGADYPATRQNGVGEQPLPVRRPWVPKTPASPPVTATPDPRAASATLSELWARRAVWMGLLALAVGAAGEALLLQEALRGFAVLLLLGAMALGVTAWSGARDLPLLAAEARPDWRQVAWRPVLFARLAGIAAAAGLAGGALVAYRAAPNAIFGLQGWLWLGSMALLLVSCARWYPRAGRERELGPAWTRGEVAVFLGLVAGALVTHLAFLDAIPWRFHFDEGFAFTEIMRYYRGPMIPLFTTTWHDTGLPSLWFAFAAGLMRFAGTGLAGVRLGVALIGALTVVPVYGIARLAWGRLAAALAGFFVVISAGYIQYSRVSILNITTAFWWAICFYFLLRGLRSRRPGDFVWAGLAAGTSQYTYYGTRLLPYLLLAFGAYLLVFHFHATRERLGHLALLVVGFFAGFGPLLGYFTLHPDMWAGRGLSTLNVPATIPTTWAALVADWNILAPLAGMDYLGFSVLAGRDTVYYAPLLLPAEAMLMTLGAGVLLWRWRQPATFLLLLTGLGVLLTGGLLIDKATIPNFAHWTPAFPVFYLALALPLALVLGALRRARRGLWLAGCVLLVVFLAGDTLANAYSYLVAYPAQVPPDHSLEAVQGRFIENLPAGARVRIVAPTWQPYYLEIGALMGPDKPGGDLLNPGLELPLVGDPSRALAFALYHDQESLLPVLQSYYPGGQVQKLQTPDGNAIATGYVLSAAQAAGVYGVQVYLGTAGSVPPAQVARVGALPSGRAVAYPVQATWSGAVYLDGTGSVRVRVEGGSAAQVWIEGQPVTFDTPLPLPRGWTRFQVQAQLAGPTTLRFLLQQGTGAFQEPDIGHLWPVAPNQGLAVTLAGPTPVHRIDPFVDARLWSTAGGSDPAGLPLSPAAGTTMIRWEGDVATRGGTYGMMLRTYGPVQLSIDNRPVVNQCTPISTLDPNPQVTGAVTLTAGWHHVQLDLQVPPGRPNTQGVEWLWTPPGGSLQTVPPSALRWSAGPLAFQPVAWPAPPATLSCP